MASNQYVNKVNCDGNILIDLTGDTVTASSLVQGYVAHDASGASITGTYTPNLQEKTVTPTIELQTITNDNNYEGLSQVTVNPIPPEYGLITWDGNVLTVS